MPRRNVTMNSYILTAFFQACCWVFLTAQELEAAFAAAASYRATQPATAFVYTALLTFCAKKAPDRALDVWHALQEVKACACACAWAWAWARACACAYACA